MEVVSEALSLANHDFSISLYTELTKTETGNIFFSPFSIHLIMFMATIGAASKTFDEMIATINLNKTAHSLDAYKNLLDHLTSKNNSLKIANGMFVDSAFNINESFVKKSRYYLQSSIEKLNFKNDPEPQRQLINNWVLKKTNYKIKELFSIGSIDEYTALVLANAVHFKCDWAKKFKDIKDKPFFLTPNNQVTVKMMSLKTYLNYYHDRDLKFAALQLPYKDHDYSMIILLPDAKNGLKDLENNFSKIKLHGLVEKMTKFLVNLKLPRFKMEHSLKLKETLSNLGCPTMFTNKANFSNMVEDDNVCVSQFVHKAYINVDKKGTEAAAASGLEITSRMMPPFARFTVNRPFIFSIISRNNDVLFLGRLVKF